MSRTARQLLGFAVALALFVAVWSLPSPAGPSPLGQRVLATLMATIALWIFGAIPNEIVTLLAVFVFEYLLFMTALALGLTRREAWKPLQQALAGVAWMAVNMGALLVGAAYWKAIGLV